jgi:hypothetical protein
MWNYFRCLKRVQRSYRYNDILSNSHVKYLTVTILKVKRNLETDVVVSVPGENKLKLWPQYCSCLGKGCGVQKEEIKTIRK